MNLKELKDFIKSLHNGKRYNVNATRKTSKLYHQNKHYFDKILKLTSFLNENVSWTERYYCILNDITEYPKCHNCNKTITKFSNVNSSNCEYRYNKFCSSKCANSYDYDFDIENSTPSNHDIKTLKELIKMKFFKEDGSIIRHKILCKDYIKELKQIKEITSFLDNAVTFAERYYCILNDIREVPKCTVCHKNKVGFNKFERQYNKFCSSNCIGKSQKKLECIVNTIEINEDDITNENLKWLINTLIFDKEKGKFIQQFSTEGNYQNIIFKKYINAIINRTSFLRYDVTMPERYYCILNDIKEYPECQNPECNNVVTYFHFEHNKYYGYQRTCSLNCAAKLRSLELSMDEESIKKRKESAKRAVETTKKNMLERTNGEYTRPSQLPEVRKKISNSLNRVEENGKTVAQNNAIKIVSIRKPRDNEKFKRTCLERWGVDNPFKTEYAKQKSKEAWQKKRESQMINYYNRCVGEYLDKDLCILTSEEDFLKDDTRIVKFKCKNCNHIFESYIKINGVYAKCKKCAIKSVGSNQQMEIYKFIESYSVNIDFNNKNIIKSNKKGYFLELDIVDYDNKFAIEYDGIIWHSFGYSKHSKFNRLDEELEKYKHLEKTEKAEEKGYQLFHIFSNEWEHKTKKEIWKSVLKSKLHQTKRIYARKCDIREITQKEADEFLNENHLQGTIKSKIKIGLFYDNVLASLMTFSRSRYDKEIEWELLRFANKKDMTTVGGASKILKYFEKKYKPKSLLSYANRRWSNGNLYYKLGFEFVEYTKPNYFYFNEEKILYSRIKFQKHKLKKFKSYSDDKTETEIMFEEGYRKIYDCGNIKFIKRY